MTMTLREFRAARSNSALKWDHYLDVYDGLFRSLGDAPVIVEIGVLRGESLALWAEYLPGSLVVGLDRSPPSREYPSNVVVYAGDQADRGVLGRVLSHGPFDLVIDDASHLYGPTQATFLELFPGVRSGGFYVIEDWAAYTEFSGYFSGTAREDSNYHLVRDLIGEMAIWKGCSRSFGSSRFASMRFYENCW